LFCPRDPEADAAAQEDHCGAHNTHSVQVT
jgi:hypothetical protein